MHTLDVMYETYMGDGRFYFIISVAQKAIELLLPLLGAELDLQACMLKISENLFQQLS